MSASMPAAAHRPCRSQDHRGAGGVRASVCYVEQPRATSWCLPCCKYCFQHVLTNLASHALFICQADTSTCVGARWSQQPGHASWLAINSPALSTAVAAAWVTAARNTAGVSVVANRRTWDEECLRARDQYFWPRWRRHYTKLVLPHARRPRHTSVGEVVLKRT